ncbi:MAG: hypothetical protein KME13_11800 [Myxacorys californica WJT36-NPBG1]|jgi:hypothetical protein|nr:hypothetical protein [Myxacorys californica WJT36-NPBG1]
MSVQVLSQERFILNCVAEQAGFLMEQEGEPYSLGIEFGIAELARVLMRQRAQMQWEHESVLLEQVLESAQDKLDQWGAQTGLSFDFTPYLPGVRKGLKFAAKEVSELSKQLALSRQSERVANREKITDGAAIPLEIVQVGLQNAIESLIVVPLAEEFALDLEGVRQVYAVQGQWFPYQVSIEPFSLLLDDDGTILIATVGVSDALIAQAKETLLVLAVQVYQPSLQD